MNRIDKLFRDKQSNILSVYYTAGYPFLDSTLGIAKALEDSGADMIEIGMPFSDPMADGTVIQQSNEIALKNGMNIDLLFRQLENLRKEISIPVLLMGYLNPVMQFGIADFCRRCLETGIDGVILPDLPPEVYTREYQKVFDSTDIYNILLITPQSDNERIRRIDSISRGFIYMVSSSSVTGAKNMFSDSQMAYFERVRGMNLKNPGLIGFGISDNDTFKTACNYAGGGIVGSAFVEILGKQGESSAAIKEFVTGIRKMVRQ